MAQRGVMWLIINDIMGEAGESGGERGIRTLDRVLTYTPLAGERLQPLGHLSTLYIVVGMITLISSRGKNFSVKLL